MSLTISKKIKKQTFSSDHLEQYPSFIYNFKKV